MSRSFDDPKFTPAPESAWLLEQIEEHRDAQLAGDKDRLDATFLRVVNRCAQLSRWAELYTPDHVNLPADDDEYWETLARAGHCA